MKKVVMVPLDDRPCNYHFPQMMPNSVFELILPPEELMGYKKTAANAVGIKEWVLQNVSDAFAVILSLDMILYGGIVPSRLHHLEYKELLLRSNVIEEIKKINPKVKLFCFELIMRCPWYSLSDEEPDYYDLYGSEIHRYGRYKHLKSLGMTTAEDEADYELLMSKLDLKCLEDFESRREKNINILMKNLAYVKDGLIDFFIVPQDDSAVYGYTSLDQIKVREYIKENGLQRKISMYPSADDTGLTMLARVANELMNKKPKVFVHYASAKGALVVPSFEDRIVDETIKFQIISAGCRRVYSLIEADILLAVNIGSAMLNRDEAGYVTAYDIERNLPEFIDQIEYALEMGKIVSIADVAHCNGGDFELLRLLEEANLLLKIHAYAGWNTSSNTLGTCICQAVMNIHKVEQKKNKKFLIHRYVEDMGYCGTIRTMVTNENLSSLGMDYFNVVDKDGAVALIVHDRLLEYMKKYFPTIYQEIATLRVQMPWRRMFEVDVKIDLK